MTETTAPRRRIVGTAGRTTGPKNTQPSKPVAADKPDKRKKRFKSISDLIKMAMVPLISKAALDEKQLGEGQISPWALDVQTVATHKDQLIEAVVDLAEEYPIVGRLIDQMGIAGPLGALVTVGITIGAQIAENHGALPEKFRDAAPVIPREDYAAMVYHATKNQDDTTPMTADNGSAA